MTKFDPMREENLQKAIKYLYDNPDAKKSRVAHQFCVPLRLFNDRLNSCPAQNTKGGYNKALTDVQEDALRSYIIFLIDIGH